MAVGKVYRTKKGTRYLKAAEVVLLAKPETDISGLKEFMSEFDEDLGFLDYLKDDVELGGGEKLCKTAGQVCYASYGPKRTKNAEAGKYFQNIISSGHGSVLEHANYSLFVYGISRSLTHELIRHRAGMGYSQLSQRYVSGKVLRFVERAEYQQDKELHRMFEERIDKVAEDYENLAKYLLEKQMKGQVKELSAESKTDLRKKVNQAARSLLPNETETWVVVTGNLRAWRHVINMRASEHAETEIRGLAYKIFKVLQKEAPDAFADFSEEKAGDGTMIVRAKHPKV